MQTRILTLAIVSSLATGMFALAPMAQARATAPQTTPTHAPPATTSTSGMPTAAAYQRGNTKEMGPDNTINCQMDFTLSGWSVFYKTASGNGTIQCDNGKSVDVVLNVKGGGLTVGAYEINDGHGNFTGVSDIGQIMGTYASATAHAGAVKSSHAAVLSKNNVTLTLTGTGNGWDIGVGFSGFTIKPASAAGMSD